MPRSARLELSSSDDIDLAIPKAFKFLFEPSRFKGAHGGRGSAKSHSFASSLLVQSVERPLRVLCCREIQNSIKESVKKLLDNKIAELEERNSHLRGFFRSTQTDIIGDNKSHYFFHGLRTNPDTIQSIEGIDIAWVEEARSASQASLDILIPTVREPESEIWFSWNPKFKNDPVDAMLRGKDRPPHSIVKPVSFRDNPFFPDVLRRDMDWDKRRNPEKYKWIWLGEYLTKSEARVFTNYRVEPFETPRKVRFYFGADWGFSVDPTVLVRCFIVDRTLFIDQEAYAVGCDIDFIPALFAGSDLHKPPRWQNPYNWPGVPGAYEWSITGDSQRPDTINHLKRRGFSIQPAKKGAGSIEDGVEFLKNFDIIIHPRCVHTADEFAMYSYVTDKLTGQVLPVLEDKKNHVIDSCRYAVEGVRLGSSYTLDNVR